MFNVIRKNIALLFSYPRDSISSSAPDYDSYWQAKRGNDALAISSFQLSRAKVVGSLIESNCKVVDIGSGNCAILKWLQENFQIAPTAVDFSQFAKQCAKNLNIPFVEAEISNQLSTTTIPRGDYLLLLEALEHLASPEELLPALLERCDNGLIFSIPNTGYLRHRLRLLCGRTPLQWLVHPGEHLRFWTVTDLSWWLTALNLPTSKVVFRFYEGVPILNRIFPNLFAEGIVVLLKKDNQ